MPDVDCPGDKTEVHLIAAPHEQHALGAVGGQPHEQVLPRNRLPANQQDRLH